MDTENDILYKLWLNEQLKHDHFKIDKAIRLFDSAENIYHMKRFDPQKIRYLGLSSVFFDNKNLDVAKRIIEECKEKDIQLISMDDEKYPQRLRQIEGHPSVLYVKGKLPYIDNTVVITIVGTRRCSRYGEDMAHRLAYELSKCGVLVISGMAEGIDSCAHKGALDASAPTVAVLAGGVDVVYPRSNENLYNLILSNGAIIAEEPPGSPTVGYKFPIRNRIMSALSMGVLVVEANNRSGVKHTVSHALDYGKDIFAVPHNAGNPLGEMPNRLISEGAKITRTTLDIIDEYINEYPHLLSRNSELITPSYRRDGHSAIKSGGNTRKKTAEVSSAGTQTAVLEKAINIEDTLQYKQLNNTEQIIVKYVYGKPSVHIDDIINGTNLDVGAVNSTVMLLQMKGMLTELPGKQFKC